MECSHQPEGAILKPYEHFSQLKNKTKDNKQTNKKTNKPKHVYEVLVPLLLC